MIGSTAATENGLAWDLVSQVGALLKSSSAANPIPELGVRAEYLTGCSQTGGYEVTYVNAIAPHFVLGDGAPVYDGYLTGTGYGFVELAASRFRFSGRSSTHPPADRPRTLR